MVRGGKGYADNLYLHSFIGFLPAYDPQFLVFIYTLNPKGVNYSSDTLAIPFLDLTKFLISYYQLPPDRSPDGQNVAGLSTTTAAKMPSLNQVVGNGARCF